MFGLLIAKLVHVYIHMMYRYKLRYGCRYINRHRYAYTGTHTHSSQVRQDQGVLVFLDFTFSKFCCLQCVSGWEKWLVWLGTKMRAP